MQTGERDMCSCGEEAWMHINGREGPKHLCRRCYALHSRQRDMRSPTYSYDREWIFPPRWKTLLQAGERDMEND
jgi:hypothetical protein